MVPSGQKQHRSRLPDPDMATTKMDVRLLVSSRGGNVEWMSAQRSKDVIAFSNF